MCYKFEKNQDSENFFILGDAIFSNIWNDEDLLSWNNRPTTATLPKTRHIQRELEWREKRNLHMNLGYIYISGAPAGGEAPPPEIEKIVGENGIIFQSCLK